jgi:hypothetical protein
VGLDQTIQMANSGTLRRIGSYAAGTHPELWHGAKYRLYRDFLRNPASRRLLNAHKPTLDVTQQKIVADLTQQGIAFCSFDQLFSDKARWTMLSESMDSFTQSDKVRQGIKDYEANFDRAGSAKEYVIKQYPRHTTVAQQDPWLHVGLDPLMLDVVNSYLGLWAKLIHFDLWYTIPLTAERPAVASQQWHRDPEDEKLIKVFMYFSDVDEGAGPFQYVPGTTPGGPFAHVWPKTSILDATYPPATQFEAVLPPANWISCTGGAGALVFCDTNGFHRGGFATTHERILATWTFVTPASLFPRRFNIESGTVQSELSPAAKFAIT